MEFANQTSFRKCGYEGVEELLWVTKDTGAFGNMRDGPLGDWISDHKTFMELVKKFDVVIQAGGNCGMYARFYKNYFKEVYTFEPDELNYYCLDRNCTGEGYHKYLAALGEKPGKLYLERYNLRNVGMHKILDKEGDVQVIRLDDMDLKDCDLIHLDVELYEEKVLRGAENTIKKFSPVIITERDGGKSYLESLGYKVHRKLRMDTVFINNSKL